MSDIFNFMACGNSQPSNNTCDNIQIPITKAINIIAEYIKKIQRSLSIQTTILTQIKI